MKRILTVILIFSIIAFVFSVKIASVQFVGLKNVSKDELLGLLQPYLDKDYQISELGGVITEMKTLIWQTGYFRSLRVRLDEDDKGNQIIIFIVEENPVLKKIVIKIDGMKLVEESDVASALNLKEGEILKPEKLKEAISNVQKMYNEAGYFLVEITPNLSEEGTLTVNITEYALWDIKFVGADEKEINFDEIKSKLGFSLLKDYYNTFWLFRWFLNKKNYYPKLENIQRAMYALSQYYYFEDVRLKPEIVKPEGVSEKVVDLIFKVRLRKLIKGKMKVDKVEVSGNKLISSTEIKKAANIEGKEIENIDLLKAAQKILELYDTKGYMMTWLETHVSSGTVEFRILEKWIKDVEYEFISGDGSCTALVPKHSNEENFIGCKFSHTRKYLVDDLVDLDRGQPLTKSKLVDVYGSLSRSNYFENVDIIPLTTKTSTEAIMRVKLKEKSKKIQFFGAISYGPPEDMNKWWEGFGGQLSISTTNPWGLGQTISLNTNLSITSKYVGLSYSIPRPFLLPMRFGISTGYLYQSPSEDTQPSTSSLNLQTSLSTLPIFGNTLSILHTFKYTLPNTLSMSVGFSHTFDSRDSILNPTKGFLLNEIFEKGGILPDEPQDYYKITGRAELYFPIYDKLYGALKGYGGYVNNIKGDEIIYTMPADSVRGYRFSGHYIYKFSTEIHYPIYTSPVSVNLVAFYDIGSAVLDLNDIGNFVDSTGIGLNIVLPMLGPMEFGMAYKIRENKFDLYYIIGISMVGLPNVGSSPIGR